MYLGEKKTNIFENQKVLIISVPRRQIATTVVPLASTKTCWRFLELVKITMTLPLLNGTIDTSFHHARHLIMRRLVIGKNWGLDV